MVIALVVSFAALGYCIWLLRKMAVEIIALSATLKVLSTETATLSNAFQRTDWNVTVTAPATKTTTKKPRARVR